MYKSVKNKKKKNCNDSDKKIGCKVKNMYAKKYSFLLSKMKKKCEETKSEFKIPPVGKLDYFKINRKIKR